MTTQRISLSSIATPSEISAASEAGRVERVSGHQIIALQDDKREHVMVGNSPDTDLKDFL